jgi:hypothetical protein
MMDDVKRLEEIEFAAHVQNSDRVQMYIDEIDFLVKHARLAIESRAAESEVEAAARAIDSCPDNDVNEWAKRALTSAAVWRKAHEQKPDALYQLAQEIDDATVMASNLAHEPKPEESAVEALQSRISELEIDRDQHRRAAGTALDRNRDLLIENERLWVQVETVKKARRAV